MIVTLCGSARFEDAFHEWNEKLTMAGHVVLGLAVYPSVKGGEKLWYTDEQKAMLDAVHKKKIDASDTIVVLNVGGYVGENTRSEVEHARARNRTVHWLEGGDPHWRAEALLTAAAAAPPRPSIDEYLMRVARVVAQRSTCPRRSVGCVLADARGLILATGYNGAPRGLAHCVDEPCPGAGFPSGTGLDLCEAVHAEQNAAAQCRDIQAVAACYATSSPCASCAKLLLNTSCRRIVFDEEYPSATARGLWLRSGREWRRHAS